MNFLRKKLITFLKYISYIYIYTHPHIYVHIYKSFSTMLDKGLRKKNRKETQKLENIN